MADDALTFDSFAMWDSDRWMGSDTYHATTGEERRLLGPFFLWQSQHGPIIDDAFLLYRIAWADETEAGPTFLSRIREVLAKAFALEGREWRNKTAMGLWYRHEGRRKTLIKSGRKGGLARAAKARASSEAEAAVEAGLEAGLEASLQAPSPSHSPSTSTEEHEVTSVVPIPIQVEPPVQQALAIMENPVEAELVEPVVVPPLNRSTFEQLAKLYLRARAHSLGNLPRAMSSGTVLDVAKKISKLKALGFPSELLVSLPVFVKDGSMRDGTDAVKAMLKDPLTLIRDEENGAKCWARKLEAQLDGMVLDARRVSILQEIRTWEWAQRMGVQAKGAAA